MMRALHTFRLARCRQWRLAWLLSMAVTSAFSGDSDKYKDAQERTGKNAERNTTLSTATFGIKGASSATKEFDDTVQK